MKDTKLRWNQKRAHYQGMLERYIQKGGNVDRLPVTKHLPLSQSACKINVWTRSTKPARNG